MQAEILTRSFLGDRNLLHYAPMTGVVPSFTGKGFKMSKSEPAGAILISDSREEIRRKVAKIPTNPENWHILFYFIWRFLLNDKQRVEVNKETMRLMKIRGDMNDIPKSFSLLDKFLNN